MNKKKYHPTYLMLDVIRTNNASNVRLTFSVIDNKCIETVRDDILLFPDFVVIKGSKNYGTVIDTFTGYLPYTSIISVIVRPEREKINETQNP